ncbi:hypothetical protein OUZ56_009700 [Daphnia magna]|uniref:Endonuclease/exonuclease/phosphatase domain-containing protein n=1 Tax=Daphnia magna TaxID=35525 RepID=A0ABR0AGS9_9CRUS|nr:hypothetical protein OUZ56_009700 [Daphnia magna]
MTANLNNHTQTNNYSHLSSALSFLQINLRHSKVGSTLLLKTMDDHKIDVVMAQEPYAVKTNDNILFPGSERVHCSPKLNEDHRYGSAILVTNSILSKPLGCSTNNVVCVKVFIEQKAPLLLISAYCRPTISSVSSLLEQFLSINQHLLKKLSNMPGILERQKYSMEQCLNGPQGERPRKLHQPLLHLEILPFLPTGTSFIDVTLHGSEIKTKYWKYLDEPSLSDRPVNSKPTNKKRKSGTLV